MAKRSRADIRRSIHGRIRKKVQGTTERPRLAVYRSINHIYAQIIDDVTGKTLAAASTAEGSFSGKRGGNCEAAATIGKTIAERAKDAGIENVVFDRGGYVYHGRVKALIDASRVAGLNRAADAAEEPGKKAEKKAEKKKTAKPAKTAKSAKAEKKGAGGAAKKKAAKKVAGKEPKSAKQPAKEKKAAKKVTKDKTDE